MKLSVFVCMAVGILVGGPPRLLGVDVAQEMIAPKTIERADTSNQDASTSISPGDPFAMKGASDGDGFVSAGPASIPSGIRVVGILALKDKPPVGALTIPGSPNVHFVSEGDVIQFERADPNKTTAVSDAQLYLLVKSITCTQIEIAPRTRPQDVRIYR
ncbi:MAG: hypothetical protein EOM20_13285 [Spartobacteria bacterium]|nr:hypothetical protein [Spartobacteria bacterium]